jgi:glutaredoxin
MIKLFTMEFCPRCEIVKDYLTKKDIAFQIMAMDTAEGITELRVEGSFAVEAPVLMNSEGEFKESAEMFPDGNIDTSVIDKLVGKK